MEVKDLDLWLHLKTGEYILQNLSIPHFDIFSFTLAGKKWINHEWLFQVVAYTSYLLGGAEGLIRMQVAVVIATFLILLFMDFDPLKKNYFSVALPLLLVLFIYRTRFTIRPDIFSLFFFAVYLYIIHKHLNKKWIIYAVPLIQILWSNFHGFFFLGIFLLFLVWFGEFIKRNLKLPWEWSRVNRLSDEDYIRLKWVFVLSILASFANPYLLDGFLYPFRIMFQLAGKSRVFFLYIQELKPSLDLRHLLSGDGFSPYKVIIIFSLTSFILNYRKLDIAKFFIWHIFLCSSITAVRNVSFFAFVAYFGYLSNKDYIFPLKSVSIHFQNNSIKLITKILVKSFFIIWVLITIDKVSAGYYYDFNKYETKSIMGGLSSKDYPSGAIDFILAHNIKGNIFNDFNSGAYLIGKCFPQIKVYIDGRTEMYGPDFFLEYKKLLDDDAKPFDEISKKYRINSAIFSGVYNPITNKLVQYLYKNKNWKVVYFDPAGIVFLKDVAQNRKLIEKYKIDLANWVPPPLDLRKLGPAAVYPYENINRAYLLEALNLNNAVMRESEEALKVMPGCGVAYKFIGRIYRKQKLLEKAAENFRLAAVYLRGDMDLRVDLALIYWKLNDLNNAIRQLEEITKISPRYSRAYYNLVWFYAKKNDLSKAEEFLSKAIGLSQPGLNDLMYIAEGLYDEKYFSLASEVYRQAIKTDKKQARVHSRLGACLVYLNRYKEAEGELNEAIKLDGKLASSYDYLGVLFAKQGLTKQARQQWGKALSLDPKDKETKESIKRFIKGEFGPSK